MINTELVEKLRCPETMQRLKLAGEELIEKLNGLVEAGRLRNRAEREVEEKLEGGLVREDGKYVYPIRHEIPIMLIDEAIEVGRTE